MTAFHCTLLSSVSSAFASISEQIVCLPVMWPPLSHTVHFACSISYVKMTLEHIVYFCCCVHLYYAIIVRLNNSFLL